MRIEEYSANELFDQLNERDESVNLEAKALSTDKPRSILETVCSFANEPGLGGGVILLGARENPAADEDGILYLPEGLDDPDKAQLDLATQCASVFNIVVRPQITVETVRGRAMLKIFVPELPIGRKPLYFKKDGLPAGAYRRVGSSDQRCTPDDLAEVLRDLGDAYDRHRVTGATIEDVDEAAVKMYRRLRAKVNPDAEELAYDTQELLEALKCVDEEDKTRLNVAGLLLFGTPKALRRELPMARVDYIRVMGNEWIEDPEESFRSIDMRGSLLLMAYRVVEAVNADLPKGFLLEGSIQAKSVGLPVKALREAVVNALMHCDYRVGRPTQVIRYDNRIEIINAGYSLKPEDELGSPGSVPRNQTIAPVFHDTNLAEAKGSGIRRMRRLMEAAHMALPTYESNREGNSFTMRLLLHHFFGEEDLVWLAKFADLDLDDGQKKALVFLREAGAVDNRVYRQLSGCDTLKASAKLTALRDYDLLVQKGRGSATYYVPGDRFASLQDNDGRLEDKGARLEDNSESLQDSGSAMPKSDSSMGNNGLAMSNNNSTMSNNVAGMCNSGVGMCNNELIKKALVPLKKRLKSAVLDQIIVNLCRIAEFERFEIAKLIKRDESYVRKILARLVKAGRVKMKYPEMPKHPHQTYRAAEIDSVAVAQEGC
jgi:ATP-dependent DNA helicase RecG